MKVLFLTLYDPFLFGGINNHLRYLSEALNKIGVDVHILISGLEAKDIELNGIKLHYFKNKAFGSVGEGLFFNFLSIPKINNLIKKYGIDIVHGQSPSSFGYALLRDKNTPFVVTLHGTSFAEIASFTSLSLKNFNFGLLKEAILIQTMMAFFTNIEYKKADVLISISEAVTKEAIAYYRLPADKIKTIHNGVIIPDIKKNMSKTEKPYVLLVVSRLTWRKGIHYLINAIPKILLKYPRTTLLIVGKGDQESSLRNLVKKLGINRSILFFKNLPKEQLLKFYNEASIYVHPSIYEPLGISILEAMSMGKCVLATNVGGIPELITHNLDGILCSPRSSLQLSEAVITLFSNPKLIEIFGNNALNKVEKHFNWDLIAKKTVKLYTALLE